MLSNWRKSSYSFSAGNCTEVAASAAGILVRDSAQEGSGPVLAFPPADWTAFLAAVRQRRES